MDSARTPIVYVALDAGAGGHARLTREVISVDVDEHVGKATRITLRLARRAALARAAGQLVEGATLVVRWRVGADLSPPFGAIIHRLEPRYASEELEVEALGRELALSRGAVRRTFAGETFRGAVEALARDAGATVRWEAREAGVRFDGQVIDDEHAWAWIQRRAGELGLEVLYDGDVLVVREPPLGDAPVAVLRWGMEGANLLAFDPETGSARRRRDDEGVVAVFVDPASGEELTHAAGDATVTRRSLARRRVAAEARGTSPAPVATPAPSTTATTSATSRAAATPAGGDDLGADLQVVLTDDAPASAPPGEGEGRAVPVVAATDAASARAHATAIANGRFRARDLTKVKARATAIGDVRLRRGRVVKVVGVDERDAGLWYARGARHRIGDGYAVELELSREGVNGRRGARTAAPAAAAPSTGGDTASASTAAGGAGASRTVDLDTGAVT